MEVTAIALRCVSRDDEKSVVKRVVITCVYRRVGVALRWLRLFCWMNNEHCMHLHRVPEGDKQQTKQAARGWDAQTKIYRKQNFNFAFDSTFFFCFRDGPQQISTNRRWWWQQLATHKKGDKQIDSIHVWPLSLVSADIIHFCNGKMGKKHRNPVRLNREVDLAIVVIRFQSIFQSVFLLLSISSRSFFGCCNRYRFSSLFFFSCAQKRHWNNDNNK